MNETTLLILTVLMLFAGSVAGMLMVLREIARTRTLGREIDELAAQLRVWLHSFRHSNSFAHTYAVLANWLENYIGTVDTAWIQVCTRLLITLEAIGFGEDSRLMLQNDESYRQSALMNSHRLVGAIEEGRIEAVMEATATLFSLFLRSSVPYEAVQRLGPLDPATELTQGLSQATKVIESDVFQAENILNKTLQKIAGHRDSEATAIPLLILKWAQFKLLRVHAMDGQRSANETFTRVAKQFTQMNRAYSAGDLSRVAELIYSGLN